MSKKPTLEHTPIATLKPYAGNARTHSKRQIEQIAQSIKRFGFTNPVLIADDLTILAGHGRVAAAKLLGLEEIPTLKLSHLSETERRAYVLADNRLAEEAGWDRELLAIELQALADLNFDVELTGFETAKIDIILGEAAEANPAIDPAPADDAPSPATQAVTRLGDVWELGRHRLVCGDACLDASYAALMGDALADIVFTDPPYNVAIDGFAGGKGKTERREFAMASGEMSEEDFTAFLTASLSTASARCRNGAIAYVCMDWRHIGEMLAAGRAAFEDFKNLCVWVKSNGGMGSFYRSQHELVFVFKKGEGPHTNTVELGRHGRSRTNVWAYAGANAFGKDRDEDLAMHPTVKPVKLIEDALRDASRRGEIVLDPFGGSGSTLIAADTCGRTARLIELDPLYCDVIVRRYEAYAGKQARLACGETFEDVAAARTGVAA